MSGLIHRMFLFNQRVAERNLLAAEAAKRLVDKRAADLELKVWRYASRIIMEGY